MSSRRAGAGKTARSISCNDEDYEQIRAHARRAQQTISDYVVERGLTVNLSNPVGRPTRSGPRLVLDEEAQREIHAWLRRALGDAPDSNWLSKLRQHVNIVLRATLIDMLWRGRRDEMRSLLTHVIGADRAARVAKNVETAAQEQGWAP